MEALTTLFRAGDADQQAEFSVPFFRAFVASLALPLSRACSSPFLNITVRPIMRTLELLRLQCLRLV